MAMPKGHKHTEAAKARITAGLVRKFSTPEGKQALADRKRGPHSEETRLRMRNSHLRRMKTDPEYRAMRARTSAHATRVARERFLATLSTTKLRIGDIPLSKGDQRLVRSLPCAICRTRKVPRQLAHIVARSQGGPQLHVWGNVIPLCEDCHASADHHESQSEAGP